MLFRSFSELEISFEELLERYGEKNLKNWGIAPWSIDATAQTLTKMFKQKRWDEALYYMGHLGHYVADLHMPLHTCANYNGQITGNEGVHFRWESRMVDELIPEFKPMGEIQQIDDYVSSALKITRESFQVYPRLLKADGIARKHLTPEQAKELNTYKKLHYEDRYLKLLYAETEDVVEGNADSGWYIPPTLVVNPPLESQILKEETFGPVMTIHPFKSNEEAVELANKTGYGLSASIFGKNKKQIKTIKS